MLFPTENEYIEWFRNAGFKDVQITRIGPWWYHGVRRSLHAECSLILHSCDSLASGMGSLWDAR
jgi:hypothetical protein